MLVSFQIGRGGRFHNGGHKSFDKINASIAKYIMDNNDLIFRDEEWVENTAEETPDADWVEAYRQEGTFALPVDEMGIYNVNGNQIMSWEEYKQARASGAGVLDQDGDYDTVIVRNAKDLDENELKIIASEEPRVMPDVMNAWYEGLDKTTLDVVAYFKDWEDFINHLYSMGKNDYEGSKYLDMWYTAHTEEPEDKAVHIGDMWYTRN